jgi:hypothetical protein
VRGPGSSHGLERAIVLRLDQTTLSDIRRTRKELLKTLFVKVF